MKKMYYSLESLRGIAALVVVLYHMRTELFIINQIEVLHRGYLFVDLFFVLSGFVITHNYLDRINKPEDLYSFLLLRLGRLYPLFIITSSFYLLEPLVEWYTGNVGAGASHVNLFVFILHLILAQSLGFNEVILNDPSWSISVEFYTYIVFALIILSISRKYRLVVICTLSAFGAIMVMLLAPDKQKIMYVTFDYGLFRCFFGFFLGVISYFLYKKLCSTNLRVGTSVILVISALLIITFVFVLPFYSYTEMLLPFLFSALIISMTLSEQQERLSAFFYNKVFLFLGKMSFSVYLIHGPIISSLRRYFKSRLYFNEITIDGKFYNVDLFIGLIFLVIVLVITFILSHVSYKYYEVPIRNTVKGIVKNMFNKKQQSSSLDRIEINPNLQKSLQDDSSSVIQKI